MLDPKADTASGGPLRRGPTSRRGRAAQDQPPAELAERLRLVLTRMSRRLRQQGDGAATSSQISALSTIARRGPLTLGELASLEHVQPPSMTRIVSHLEDSGLVRREADVLDRRVARVSVTPEGTRLLQGSRRRKSAYIAQRIAELSQHDRAVLGRAAALLEAMLAEDDE